MQSGWNFLQTFINTTNALTYHVRKKQLDLPCVYFPPLSDCLFRQLKHGKELLLSGILPQEMKRKKEMLWIGSAINAALIIGRGLKINPHLLTTLRKGSKVCLETFNVCLFLVSPPAFVPSQLKAKSHELIGTDMIEHGSKRRSAQHDNFVSWRGPQFWVILVPRNVFFNRQKCLVSIRN